MAKRELKRTQISKRRQRRDPALRLLDEVGSYLNAKGGRALVAGPIEIAEDAERIQVSESPLRQFFAVTVMVMGKRPVFGEHYGEKSFWAEEKGDKSPGASDAVPSAPEKS